MYLRTISVYWKSPIQALNRDEYYGKSRPDSSVNPVVLPGRILGIQLKGIQVFRTLGSIHLVHPPVFVHCLQRLYSVSPASVHTVQWSIGHLACRQRPVTSLTRPYCPPPLHPITLTGQVIPPPLPHPQITPF